MCQKSSSEKLIEQYELEMEQIRCQMIKEAMHLGMNHPIVLEYSKKLDRLHNKLLKLLHVLAWLDDE